MKKGTQDEVSTVSVAGDEVGELALHIHGISAAVVGVVSSDGLGLDLYECEDLCG